MRKLFQESHLMSMAWSASSSDLRLGKKKYLVEIKENELEDFNLQI